ncbi:hypothetical protein LJC00_03620 [Dysgonomonas sp. OttesenSCG-928-M03]|nr:hypothetical protein [Dysgonomonas sp. OttesenSCG-928-M03]
MKVRFIIIAILMIVGLVISIFATNRLTRFCLYTPIKVLIVSSGIAMILWAISDFVFENIDVKGYFELKGKDLFFYPLFVCFSCCIASYTIFLCKLKSVRESNIFSFCSFFVFPLMIAWAIIGTQSETNIDLIQTIYYCLAFIVPQTYFYIEYTKGRKKREWERD